MEPQHCRLLPNYTLRKDGTCPHYDACAATSWWAKGYGALVYVHTRLLHPLCVAKKPGSEIGSKIKGGGKSMDQEERERLKKIPIDEKAEKQVVEDLKTMPIWDVTEKFYGQEFDHSDRQTWLFYSKINAIRKKAGLPAVKPARPEPEESEESEDEE